MNLISFIHIVERMLAQLLSKSSKIDWSNTGEIFEEKKAVKNTPALHRVLEEN